MTPEQLVPTIDICKMLKSNGYKQGNSHFAYMVGFSSFRLTTNKNQQAHDVVEYVDAPTLQELLDRLPKYTYVSRDGAAYIVTAPPDKPDSDGYSELDDNFNAAEAAALLWLELHKEVVV